MAYFKIEKDRNGEMFAKIRVSYKDHKTGQFKISSKRYRNKENLTEAKFRKYLEREAIKYEDEVNNAIEEEINEKDRILTFHELADEWLQTIKMTLSYNYYERGRYTVGKFNNFLKQEGLYEKPISEIKVRDVQLFLNQGTEIQKLEKPKYKLKNEPKTEYQIPTRVKTKDGYWNEWEARRFCKKYNLKFEKDFEITETTFRYSLTTLKGYRRLLRTIFNEAIRYEWIMKNPVCNTKVTANSNNGTIRPITEKEVFTQKESHDFIKTLDRFKSIYINKIMPLKIMLFTGLRNGEVHALRWDDIDFNKKVVHVTKARYYSHDLGIFEKEPKSKTSIRDVPLPDYLLQELEEYKEWFRVYDDNFDQKLDQYFIVSNDYREPADPKRLNKWLSEFEVKNNLKHVTCHGLRHTYCSLLLSNNVPIQTVSKYMGHSDSAITLKVYSHFMPETQIIAINAITKIVNDEQ